MRVTLQNVAHVRSGDKGNTSNVTVCAFSEDLYRPLKEQLTPERVRKWYSGLVTGPVERYSVDHLWVLNFVLQEALAGGVSRSLRLDQYGKALSAAVLGIELDIPDGLVPQLRGR
jgi:hypothetical protein